MNTTTAGFVLSTGTVTLGTCSLCGGPVVCRQVQVVGEDDGSWCSDCGARPKEPKHGPIIEMSNDWKK